MRDDMAAFLAHSKKNLSAFGAASVVDEASSAFSATLVWHTKTCVQKLKILSKIVF
jgi:hypothetical protein